ncbi:MAG: ATP-binding cassette domain-containing protein [Pseudomonadota bacterium]
MAAPPLIAVRNGTLGFGERPLFVGLDCALHAGERTCLVGRNGCGKSSLLQVMAGQLALDRGERQVRAGTTIAYLPQDPVLPPERTIAEYVAEGLGAEEAWHKVDAVLPPLGLDGARPLEGLSGGEGRRAALARVLVGQPSVLLLDEPTNHLDLPAIEWLEETLAAWSGAFLLVSHDRAFLARVTRAVLWLDRGQVRRLDQGFERFEAWAEAARDKEAHDRQRLDVKIAQEERYAARGVTARRRRNQRRLAHLAELRQQRDQWLRQTGSAKLDIARAEASGKAVIEAEGLTKGFGDKTVVRDFSIRIRRGDRIGLIGPNGAGKTTLARMLIGDLAPDSGSLKLGTKLAPLYYDQRRESLDGTASLWRTLVPDGGDSILVGDRQRHVVSYLRDFLFAESQARQPVRTLSGGEKNRLLLARLFAKPSNLLVLDEPTNDLDLETLDLLQEVLDDYPGTLLLISHDRDFLDRLVTGVIALEAGGRWQEVVGGYADYRRQAGPQQTAPVAKRDKPVQARAPRKATKLSHKDQRALDALPGEIEQLGAEIAKLETALADPELYGRDPAAYERLSTGLSEALAKREAAETRWLELEELKESLAAARQS